MSVLAYGIARIVQRKFAMTDQELELAHAIFRSQHPAFQVDLTQPRNDWLRVIREASYLSKVRAAALAGCHVSTYAMCEAREKAGTISLKSLSDAAGAMDCELVYYLRPKRGEEFSRRLWREVFGLALERLDRWPHPRWMRAHALATVARIIFRDPKSRREHGWTPRPVRKLSY